MGAVKKEVRYQAYAIAVALSIVDLYDKSREEAENLTTNWWNALSATKAWKSGLFLHVEPLETAAELLHVKQPSMTDSLKERYSAILHDSMNLAISNNEPRKKPVSVTSAWLFDDETELQKTRVLPFLKVRA